jgi:hypothetical protein
LAKGSGSSPYYSDDCEDENSKVKPKASHAVNDIEKHDESLYGRINSNILQLNKEQQRLYAKIHN